MVLSPAMERHLPAQVPQTKLPQIMRIIVVKTQEADSLLERGCTKLLLIVQDKKARGLVRGGRAHITNVQSYEKCKLRTSRKTTIFINTTIILIIIIKRPRTRPSTKKRCIFTAPDRVPTHHFCIRSSLSGHFSYFFISFIITILSFFHFSFFTHFSRVVQSIQNLTNCGYHVFLRKGRDLCILGRQ